MGILAIIKLAITLGPSIFGLIREIMAMAKKSGSSDEVKQAKQYKQDKKEAVRCGNRYACDNPAVRVYKTLKEQGV